MGMKGLAELTNGFAGEVVLPGDPGYDSAEPDVWFYDEGSAERNGFRRSEG